ncbi:MAG: aminopeptidase P family protein [Candidatus Thorarchaeota archaeon]|nr:aminopeptidase P family protein [Candidatus Thorarchaeota archaeon]
MLEDLDQLMEKYGIDGLLVNGSAFENQDIYWLTGFRSSDEIIYLKNRGDEPLVASSFLALERVKKESLITQTHDLTEVHLQILREKKKVRDNQDRIYGDLLKKQFSGKVLGVPDIFPASILVMLQKMGYTIKVVRDLVMEARATKSPREIKTLKKAGDATTAAIAQIVEMVKESTIGPNKILMHRGEPLTVRKVKLALEHFLLDKGAESADDAIVAVGKKAFDWHYLGVSGDKFKSETPIIMDVFPRLKQERYIADVTRTIVKGSVPKRVREMFDAVHSAAEATVDALRDNVVIEDVNLACFNTLKKHGFDSKGLNPDAKDGMTHGLGHGIGLDVHELPSTYSCEERYVEGNVMAIEPGVYLASIGGVRIENDYVVTKGKAKRLTTGLDDIIYV